MNRQSIKTWIKTEVQKITTEVHKTMFNRARAIVSCKAREPGKNQTKTDWSFLERSTEQNMLN